MKIYTYNEEGIVGGEIDAKKDPLQSKKDKKDVFLVPRLATTIKPPKVSPPEVAIFDLATETWSITEDHRLTEYWLPDEWESPYPPHIVKDLGPLPVGALLERPPRPQEDIDRENLETEGEIKGVAVRDRFKTQTRAERKDNFTLEDKIVRCLFDREYELAEDFANDLTDTALRTDILGIINS